MTLKELIQSLNKIAEDPKMLETEVEIAVENSRSYISYVGINQFGRPQIEDGWCPY
jgi:hypothetical protein